VDSNGFKSVVFSVTNDYSNDPSQDPNSYTVNVLKKGCGSVNASNTGGPGSGAESSMAFDWQTGTTYAFLVQAEPLLQDFTIFTGWFHDPLYNRNKGWRLLASF
jgi:hypothetical protein